MENKYFLGLDIGTDSVGYATTNTNYELLKFKGEPLWGISLFDEAQTAEKRRSFRCERRRLQRRKQRVLLLQELFAKEIGKSDSGFYIRIKNSALNKKDKDEKYCIFNDKSYTDVDFHKEYPTIHHLIVDLMNSDKQFDVRLLYLACAWLVVHRGHFLSDVSKRNISNIKDFHPVYVNLCEWFNERDYALPDGLSNESDIEKVFKSKKSISKKYEQYKKEILGGKKPLKSDDDVIDSENFIKLLCGSSVKIKDTFKNETGFDTESIALSEDDSVLAEIISKLSDDNSLLLQSAKSVYDWSMLTDILQDKPTISEAKVCIYETHKSDLKWLKEFVKKYCNEKYRDLFCDDKANDNYNAYSKNNSAKENFFKKITKILKDIIPENEDKELYDEYILKINSGNFLPKQVTTENRVIPYQLYWYELDCILNKAEVYLPFLSEKDEKGLTVSDKIRSIFEFRVPYFVGPLNPDSDLSWIKKKTEGKIYPWNIEEIVDYDASENEFIRKMTGKCTYLPGNDVLPKNSLLYHKFMVLNEINNLKIDDIRISSVELKQKIYNEVFLKQKKVTRKKIESFLIRDGYMYKDSRISGIDEQIHSDLKPQHDFRNLINKGILSESDAEEVILRLTVTEDKRRIANMLKRDYPALSKDDVKYISNLRYSDFGRLSKRFLCEVEGVSDETGEVSTIIQALWNTNNNLMELLSDKYTFIDEINKIASDYYLNNPRTLAERLDEMYISNAVKRPILRAIDIVKDITKAMKNPPEKIFVEMPRGGTKEQKNKRTISRKQQILDLYEKSDEDTSILRKQLEEMGETANSRLQSKALFLYYMQLGKCAYTGEPIELTRLSSDYNIDHIYPQAYVKDDSILNNLVLVKTEENGRKSDGFPIDLKIRQKMSGFWEKLKNDNLITEEKYKRLTRSHEFTQDEKWGFINRQLTETSQAAKAITVLLKELYPETELVYVKAGLVSEFRQEYNCLKSRLYNDLHHAKDAYLNIVVGNVYNSKFTKKWFTDNHDQKYSIKTETLFGDLEKNKNTIVKCGNSVVWNKEEMLPMVIKTMYNDHAHMVRYSYFRKGGFFDQMPIKAKAGLFPRKKGLDTETYGGYNKLTITGFILVKYTQGKKSDIMITPIPLISCNELNKGEENAQIYIKQRLNDLLSKPVDSISFPLGMRLLKINTMFSVDGYRFCLAGASGIQIISYPFMPFSSDRKWNNYIKALEQLNEKFQNNSNYYYNSKNDKVTSEENIELYDLYINKLQNTIYSKRPAKAKAVDIIVNGRDKFIALNIKEQVSTLLSVHSIFGRTTNGCDLENIGGDKHSAKSCLSWNLSNWKKYYSDVRIIDCSPAGLWEKKSQQNLLELL